MSVHSGCGSPLLVAQVFPDRDIFHFRCDNALSRVPELSDRMFSGTAKSGRVSDREKFPVVRGVRCAWRSRHEPRSGTRRRPGSVRRPSYSSTSARPRIQARRKGGSPSLDLATKGGIAPWTAGVINADVCIFFGPAVRQPGGGLGNLPQTHSHIGVDLAWEVNPAAVWVERISCGHGNYSAGPLWRLLPSTVLTVSGSKGPPEYPEFSARGSPASQQ